MSTVTAAPATGSTVALPAARGRSGLAGAIRSDVEAADLLKALSGICLVSDQPGWQEQARRLVNLLHDGLRYRAPIS